MDQVKAILDRGAAEHGFRFLVQHNGLRPKGTLPNRYVRGAAKRNGSMIGFQTVNSIATAEEMGSALSNAYDNSDAVFIEVYSGAFEALKGAILDGRTFKQWAEKFHERRREKRFLARRPIRFPTCTATGSGSPAARAKRRRCSTT